MEDTKKKILIRNIVLLTLFIGIASFLFINYGAFFIKLIGDTPRLREFILSFGNGGLAIYAIFQIIHVILPIIPGEVVQIGSGYIFGTLLGSGILIIGTSIGTIIVFSLSRFIGYPIVKIFISEEKMVKFNFLINHKRIDFVMAVLFMVPGVPKDTLIYLAGLTPIKPIRFFLISITARIPALVTSCFIGANIMEKDYQSIVWIGAVLLVIVIISILYKNKIMKVLKESPT